jgi:hypothetical protein
MHCLFFPNYGAAHYHFFPHFIMLRFISIAMFATLLFVASADAQTTANINALAPTVKTTQKYRFPMVELAKNVGIAAEINEEIVLDMTNHLEAMKLPMMSHGTIQDILDNLATYAKTGSNEVLTEVNYQVLYNKNNLLSLKIVLINDNDHADDRDFYFNFDLRSGARLTLADVIEPSQMASLQEHFKENMAIRNTVVVEKIMNNPNYRNNILTKELVRKCLAEVSVTPIRDFAFTNDGIRICADYKPFVDILKAKPQDDFLYQYSFVRCFLKSDVATSLRLI